MHWLPVIAVALTQTDLPSLTVDRDNVDITQSCRLNISADHIVDADGNGVIHITTSNITVDLASAQLHGAATGQWPNQFAGIGIRITANNVTLRNAKVSGYKVGIHAINAEGLTIHDTDVSNNFHQRLRSTPGAEDASDWLWPHANDDQEWRKNYGAGICVENSSGVRLYNIRARKTQNGIILDRVNHSRVYDCDCSFLSGWGLAMWRSNHNVISRNAFDFCVRGYSHGVYNRGQDSAGILMFEQCGDNVIVENSATHGGDGIFCFAGKEALGEVNPRDDLEWYKRRGCNDNVFAENDLSFAAAHGLEVTFSFGNRVSANRVTNNAICGIWGGYSQDTGIAANLFEGNGDAGYGLERGGINIEHGRRTLILQNTFRNNARDIHLWWDDDANLFRTPWYRANGGRSDAADIVENVFEGSEVAIQLRDLGDNNVIVTARNRFQSVAQQIERTENSPVRDDADIVRWIEGAVPAESQRIGKMQPRGQRRSLQGRENIIMTEWGPWDHESPMLRFERTFDHADQYRLYKANVPNVNDVRVDGNVKIDTVPDEQLVIVRPVKTDTLEPYAISFDAVGATLTARGTLTGGTWEIWTFKSACDPREDVDRWRHEGEANHQTLTANSIDFRFGSRGMSEARSLPVKLAPDHFGVIATRSLTIPPGTWRLTTTSDDGIRVWMNDDLVIDDWTHHGPTRHDHEFTLTESRTFDLRIEYFELDGYAVLAVDFEKVE